jgi:phosphomevalonate kinase
MFDKSKYSNIKKIILLSGKRKSGKDYVGEILAEKLQAVLLHLSEPLKLEYARLYQINGEQLLNSSSYKENYRKDMIKYMILFKNKKKFLIFLFLLDGVKINDVKIRQYFVVWLLNRRMNSV